MKKITVVGGGLAGCEAAYYLAERGIEVTLYEMRHGEFKTFAHKTDGLAELVCSNSFRNDDINSAIGLLHEEMRILGSLIMETGDNNKLPAGGALAVDREKFSYDVENKIKSHQNIKLIREEYTKFNINDELIVATGPLTSDKFSKEIIKYTGEENLAFFDAIAPIIYKDSINFDFAWWQSRYDKTGPAGSGKDYINCPLSEEIYNKFVDRLLESEKGEFKNWEKDTPYFDGCLPIEVIASRGRESLRFGPMKPVGLTDPSTGKKPYAVIQLRQDNKLGNLYNIVGFQTKMKYDHQKEIFRMIPGLEKAEFARMGGIHRNSFINSPKILNEDLSLKNFPNIRFAGQITGVEGYIESAACGLMAAIFAIQKLKNCEKQFFPQETALGSLLSHITTNAQADIFQPMNINYGLFPGLNGKIPDKAGRKTAYSNRAVNSLKEWVKSNNNYKEKTYELC